MKTVINTVFFFFFNYGALITAFKNSYFFKINFQYVYMHLNLIKGAKSVHLLLYSWVKYSYKRKIGRENKMHCSQINQKKSER